MKKVKTVTSKIGSLIVPVLLIAAVMTLFISCTPEWLPDSSGFVYVASDGNLVVYNLETKKSTRIAMTKLPGARAAVWPDGKKIAIAQFDQAAEGKISVTNVVYDLKGNEKHRSPAFIFKAANGGTSIKNDKFSMPRTYVSNDMKHIAAFIPSLEQAIHYDIEAKKFRLFEHTLPPMSLTIMRGVQIDTSPFVPDSSALLLLQTNRAEKGDGVAFFKLKEKTIHHVKFDKTLEDAAPDEKSEFSVTTEFRWKKSALYARANDKILNIHSKSLESTMKDDMRSQQLFQHAEKHKVHVLCELDDGALLQMSKTKGLQLYTREGNEPVSLGGAAGGEVFTISPSPDRKLFVIRAIGKGDQLRVFNTKGDELAKIEHGPLAPPKK